MALRLVVYRGKLEKSVCLDCATKMSDFRSKVLDRLLYSFIFMFFMFFMFLLLDLCASILMVGYFEDYLCQVTLKTNLPRVSRAQSVFLWASWCCLGS